MCTRIQLVKPPPWIKHGGGFTLTLIMLSVKHGKLKIPLFIFFILTEPEIDPKVKTNKKQNGKELTAT